MTNWTPDLDQQHGPRYAAIADALAADVAGGRLKPGDRLPTHRDLGWRLGVTVGTVSRAYAEAERRGLISGEVGRGTFVRGPVPLDSHMMPLEAEAANEPINLSFAFPPAGDEARYLGDSLEALARDPQSARLLDYQPHAGSPAHRAMGAAWLARSGIAVDADQVVLTAGAQHGIAVCLAANTRPGDRILAERLTYSGLQSVARVMGLKIEGLASDDEGLRPDGFAAACRAGDYKALYCVPTLQNPTTTIMPEARRREIAAIAQEHGVVIIEDDIFSLLIDRRPPPLWHFAPEQTFALTSLSKTVSPGLRVGYAAGPAAATARLSAAVRATCWMSAPLTCEIASRWIRDGTADRILETRQHAAATRRAVALDILGPWDVACPPGSIFLWLRLPEPWRSADFALEAQRRGVALTPVQASTVSRDFEPHAVRVCLGAAKTNEQLAQGLTVLAELLDAGVTDSFSTVV